MFDEGASFGKYYVLALSWADGFYNPAGAANVVVSAGSVRLDENVGSVVVEVLLVVGWGGFVGVDAIVQDEVAYFVRFRVCFSVGPGYEVVSGGVVYPA